MSSSRMIKKSCSSVTGLLLLLLLICLAETATGSCLSYGHSCWGAHGKRSGNSPSSAPDWYLTKILRRMAVNSELNHARRVAAGKELSDILPSDAVNNASPINNMLINDETPYEVRLRNIQAKPMLDDSVLSNMKIWQLMRQPSDDK